MYPVFVHLFDYDDCYSIIKKNMISWNFISFMIISINF